MMPAPTPCRHCGSRKVTRPRGLCWTCYYTPAVSALYPSTSKLGRRGARPDQIELPGAKRFDWRREQPPGLLPVVLAPGEERLLLPRRVYDRLGCD
jgi:hypothetical protein